MPDLCLFSRDTPLAAFARGAAGTIVMRKVFEENAHLLPHAAQGKDARHALTEWLGERIGSPGRKLAKLLAGSGMPQEPFDIMNLTHALSLDDDYWIHDGTLSWEKENLFARDYSREIAEIAFRQEARKERVNISEPSPEWTTSGMMPKCWEKRDGTWFLVKGDFSEPGEILPPAVAEWLAWKVAEAVGLPAAPYDLEERDGHVVSICPIFTSEGRSFVSAGDCLRFLGVWGEAISEEKVAGAEGQMTIGNATSLEAYEDMSLFDALVGNIDRHFGNFGMIFDAGDGRLLEMAPAFDHGLSFMSFLSKKGRSFEQLAAHWRHGCFMPFDRMLEVFVRERHREKLEKLLEFEFPEHPLVKEKGAMLATHFLRMMTGAAMKILNRRA